MSEFTDLLLQVFPAKQALLFLGLAGVDWIQTQYLTARMEALEGRVGRVEGAFIEPDDTPDASA